MQTRFLQPLSNSKTITGPVVSLRKAAQSIGFQITQIESEIVCVYQHMKMPITTTPKRVLTQVLQKPWEKFVASTVTFITEKTGDSPPSIPASTPLHIKSCNLVSKA